MGAAKARLKTCRGHLQLSALGARGALANFYFALFFLPPCLLFYPVRAWGRVGLPCRRSAVECFRARSGRLVMQQLAVARGERAARVLFLVQTAGSSTPPFCALSCSCHTVRANCTVTLLALSCSTRTACTAPVHLREKLDLRVDEGATPIPYINALSPNSHFNRLVVS